MAKLTHSQELQADTQLIAGFQKHLPSGTFTILGQSQTTAQVVAVLQGRVDKATAVETAKAAAHAAVLAANQEYTDTHAYVSNVRATVLAMYSTSPDILADFGESPRKPRKPLTAAQRLIADEKRQATRQARGIIGKNKRALVTGTVPSTIVVPVPGATTSGSPTPPVAPTPPAPPAAPATTSNGSSTTH